MIIKESPKKTSNFNNVEKTCEKTCNFYKMIRVRVHGTGRFLNIYGP